MGESKRGGGAIRMFFDANRRLCGRIEAYLPQAKPNIWALYLCSVAEKMNAEPGRVVADIGGGKSCQFAERRIRDFGTKIIGVDVSDEELDHNTDVDERRVADVTRKLPFEPGEVDLVTSRSVLEHLQDLEGFIANCGQVLEPGSHFVHILPSRYAPFALINRALPEAVSRRVLFFFQPESKGICGFRAFYDHCYATAIHDLLTKHGFKVENLHVSYYQSGYFGFFAPLFILSALYEMVIREVDARNLGAYVLVVARKI